jgi:hypothetical protein
MNEPEDLHGNADDDQPEHEAHPHNDRNCGARRQPPIVVRQENLWNAEKLFQALAPYFAFQDVLSLIAILI